ncbi:MAG: DUF1800 domain-containing protein, partial [Phaeodactylibacter sp.]|nr:DUF1800 domain-containing protein [Phaeodactylibacter sp.]
PDPPVNYYYQDDPNVAVGETWIQAPYSLTENYKTYRFQSLHAWTVGQILLEGISVREKMTLFWHNHFVTGDISDPKFNYDYITLLRSSALGNFRQLVKDITINASMLRYLNGNQNTNVAPNENYARELLELFTIGKGDLAGPGDYTTFTETDVVEIAKVLTGWRDVGFNTQNPDVEVGSAYLQFRHDTSTKQLSERFDNAVIANANEEEYKNLIDIIFLQPQVARFISRKLYRWFVYYIIDDEVETNVIEPMAQLLIDEDFEVKPVLDALFKSQHFYDILQRGAMIKNPVDFLASILKPTEVQMPDPLFQQYSAWLAIAQTLPAMQMEIYNPPDVAGWKAYYQEPLFYRTWINSVTLPYRMSATDLMTTTGFMIGTNQVRIDVLTFVFTLDNPYDPNDLIDEWVAIFFPQPITDNQRTFLKEALIPGLPDFEWTVEFTDYASAPTNSALAAAVETKLRNLLKAMMSMPEFYLS